MLEIRELSLAFGSRILFSGYELNMYQGQMGVLKGPNGCGKTSLLNCITGVIPEYVAADVHGSILLEGMNLTQIPLKEKFHYLWYSPADSREQFFFPTCEAELAFALENMGLNPMEIRKRITAAIARFGLDEDILHAPDTLSTGQKNLLQCAMAEALDPALIMLDEPSRGLAAASLDTLCTWLQDLKARGKIILCAEHHPRLAEMADKVIELSGQ